MEVQILSRAHDLLRREAPLGRSSAPLRTIENVLDACALVPSREVAPDIVTMYSQVLLHDAADGTPSKITLCYPADAEPAAGFVSVLSPVGQALLGLQAGELARWTTPDGRTHAARIEALLFQPEASGDYTL